MIVVSEWMNGGEWQLILKIEFQLMNAGPGWCGSVSWALACELKDCQFDCLSGFWAGSHLAWERQLVDVSLAHQCFPSLFPPFPLLWKESLKNEWMNKWGRNARERESPVDKHYSDDCYTYGLLMGAKVVRPNFRNRIYIVSNLY